MCVCLFFLGGGQRVGREGHRMIKPKKKERRKNTWHSKFQTRPTTTDITTCARCPLLPTLVFRSQASTSSATTRPSVANIVSNPRSIDSAYFVVRGSGQRGSLSGHQKNPAPPPRTYTASPQITPQPPRSTPPEKRKARTAFSCLCAVRSALTRPLYLRTILPASFRSLGSVASTARSGRSSSSV